MRVLLIVLALIVASASLAFANGASNGSTTPTPQPPVVTPQPAPEQPTAQPAPSGAGGICPPSAPTAPTNQMMNAFLMRCFGLTEQQISNFRAQGLSDADIIMAASIASRSNCSINQVVTSYMNNRDWTTVARQYNVSISDLTMMPSMASVDSETFNRTFVSQYYGISQSTIMQLRNSGYSWDDIYLMSNASVRTRQSIDQIAALRSQGMSWNDIATRYSVAVADITSPVPMRSIYTYRTAMGAGPAPNVLHDMYDVDGNVFLTEDQARWYYRSGFDWMEVAIAANIARYSGYPIELVLTSVRNGMTWNNILWEYGVPESVAFNVTDYPFERRSTCSQAGNCANIERIAKYQVAPEVINTPCGPMCPPVVVNTCPPPCPPATPAPSAAGPQVVCPPPCPQACPSPCPATTNSNITCPCPTCPKPTAVPARPAAGPKVTCPPPCPQACPSPCPATTNSNIVCPCPTCPPAKR